MRSSRPLLARLPVRVRKVTSRQSWNAFVESVTSSTPHETQSLRPLPSSSRTPIPTPTTTTHLREELPTNNGSSSPQIPAYRRFKPVSRFSIYKMTEIQRTINETADYKLVFYAPVDSVNRIKDAIFEVGGGVLGGGKYTRCCFQSYGTGQFRPEIGAVPGDGQGGLGVTRVMEEVKVEILCHGRKITKAAVRALLHTHPRDAPIYEVYKTEFGFLPHQLVPQPTHEQRLSWRPRTKEQDEMNNVVQDKIAKQFEGAKLTNEHTSATRTTSESRARVFLNKPSSATWPQRQAVLGNDRGTRYDSSNEPARDLKSPAKQTAQNTQEPDRRLEALLDFLNAGQISRNSNDDAQNPSEDAVSTTAAGQVTKDTA